MIHRKFSQEEVDYLIQNYAELGVDVCAKHLGRNTPYVAKKANALGLYRKQSEKWHLSRSPRLVDMAPFLSITDPRVAYTLGFIWADGHVTKTKHGIVVETHRKDFEDLKECFLTVVPFHIHFPKRNDHVLFHIHDLSLHSFLSTNDYQSKSIGSPTKILSKIPLSLHHYFFRGYFDGDGCFSQGKGGSCISFTGAYTQDWTDTINYITRLTDKVPKVIRRNVSDEARNSFVYFYGKNRIKTFLSVLYAGQQFGLSRKRVNYELFMTNLQ